MVVETLDPIVAELRRIRKEHSITQRDLAVSTGRASHQSIQAWETGVHEPTLGHLRQWAKTLGYDIVLVPRRGR